MLPSHYFLCGWEVYVIFSKAKSAFRSLGSRRLLMFIREYIYGV